MSGSIVARAAKAFLVADSKRRARPVLTPREKAELSLELTLLAPGAPLSEPIQRAGRGEAVVALVGYKDDFDEMAANVIADIMHAAKARGHEPAYVLARARGYYYAESGDYLAETEHETPEEQDDATQDDHHA